MKLSAIKGERTLDVIAELIDPVTDIAESKEFQGMFEKKKLPKGMTKNQFFISRVRKNLPGLIKAKRESIIHIMAVLKGVDDAVYVQDMTMASLFTDVFELITDPVFLNFLSTYSQTTESLPG